MILTSPRIPHVDLARAAVDMRVPVLQLREKTLPDGDLMALSRSLTEVTRDTETLFIVNDRPDIAAEAGADGVHVGQSDAACESARAILGPDALVGVSARDSREAMAAVAAGADYVGAGPVFPTDTKPDALDPIAPEGLCAVCRSIEPVPCVAIGGIGPGNVNDVIGAGARYYAVISAICHADDPVAAMDTMIGLARTEPGHTG